MEISPKAKKILWSKYARLLAQMLFLSPLPLGPFSERVRERFCVVALDTRFALGHRDFAKPLPEIILP